MFSPPDSWVWDFWFADDGEHYHLFFLYASRALHNPDDRHHRASIGHAISTDLVHWERIADALVRSDAPAFDDLATWTGSVVRDDDDLWQMFYTGASLGADGRNVQRVGRATSTDLITWHKDPRGALLHAEPPYYETLATSQWHDEAFRDPWVFRNPSGSGWEMLITARSTSGDTLARGVVGRATSSDLTDWTLLPPASEVSPDGFGQLEVLQVAEVEGRVVLIFSCHPQHGVAGHKGAIWAVNAESLTPIRHLAGLPTDRDGPVRRETSPASRRSHVVAIRLPP